MANKQNRSLKSENENNVSFFDNKGVRNFGNYFLSFLSGGAIFSIFILVFSADLKQEKESCLDTPSLNPPGSFISTPIVSKNPEICCLHQLLALSPSQLEKIDIGLMNLLCAEGLPGAENLDVTKCLTKLDDWAEHIKEDTEHRMTNFHQNPAKYDNSINFFKMVNLILTLKEDMGISYNLMNMTDPDFTDSREMFIHGLLGDENHGSCTNLPVLCIAVGRRLGYPLKLVPTAEHLFVRWDDAENAERFNMEVSCEGTDTLPDEHYRNWPRKLSKLDNVHGYYLKSLTPEGELAAFLHFRGDILAAAKKPAQAQVAYAQGYSLMPGTMEHLLNLAATVDREVEKLARKDFETMGASVKYTVCPTMDEKELENAWIYRYPK